ncbi:MAG: hypothetical protein Q4C22_04170 [Bacillota bacterium]|nr:hypothetical protein [Bacillota bacterium]
MGRMIKQSFHASAKVRRAEEKIMPGPVVTYQIPKTEVEKRYGRPGELAEKAPLIPKLKKKEKAK